MSCTQEILLTLCVQSNYCIQCKQTSLEWCFFELLKRVEIDNKKPPGQVPLTAQPHNEVGHS